MATLSRMALAQIISGNHPTNRLATNHRLTDALWPHAHMQAVITSVGMHHMTFASISFPTAYGTNFTMASSSMGFPEGSPPGLHVPVSATTRVGRHVIPCTCSALRACTSHRCTNHTLEMLTHTTPLHKPYALLAMMVCTLPHSLHHRAACLH